MFRESISKEVTFQQRDQNKVEETFPAEWPAKAKALQWACALLTEERQGGKCKEGSDDVNMVGRGKVSQCFVSVLVFCVLF